MVAVTVIAGKSKIASPASAGRGSGAAGVARRPWRSGGGEASSRQSPDTSDPPPPRAHARATPVTPPLLVLAPTRDHLLRTPLVEDLLAARAGLGHGVLRRQRARRGLGEHVGDHVGVEDLAFGRIGKARVAEVRRPR